MRRFGQSIKRIVREVEEQNSGKGRQLRFLEVHQINKKILIPNFLESFWYFKEIKLILVIQVDESRDVLVNRNVALNRASDHLTKVSAKKNKLPLNFVMMVFSLQCYIETLNSMVTLQNQYLESKNEKNIFHRYNRLRSMVKV